MAPAYSVISLLCSSLRDAPCLRAFDWTLPRGVLDLEAMKMRSLQTLGVCRSGPFGSSHIKQAGMVVASRLFLAFLCSASLAPLCSGVPGPIYSDPGYSFVQNATFAPTNSSSYDYIIIGGGTAGCPLAATLSSNFSVLLLERGGQPYNDSTVRNLDQYATIQQQATENGTTAGQRFVSEDGVINLRANVLGGGSAVNAGFYTYASPAYVRRFGWDQALVNASYAWVTRVTGRFPVVRQWQNAFRNGLLQAGILPYNGATYEHLPGTKVGGSIFDDNGIRHTAADLLQYADATRLTVHTGATVEEILLQPAGSAGNGTGKPRAYGVRYRDPLGAEHTATLRDGKGEVILAAGALGSPQLLMLSGIGPASKLEPFGIEVKVPLEAVGEGMADNPTNGIFVPSPTPVENSLIEIVGITNYGSFIEGASGNGTMQIGQGSLSTVAPGNRTLGLLQQFNDRLRDLSQTILEQLLQGGIFLQKVIGPIATGSLRLQSANVKDNPTVRFNYYSEPEDLQACVDGVRVIDRVIRSSAFRNFRYELPLGLPGTLRSFSYLIGALPPIFVDDTERLGQWCRDTVITIWHYHGGCRVGAVVDSKTHRVFGVDALRVIDGSTWNFTPGTNPQASVMMFGRYMGVKMLRERAGDSNVY